MATQLVEVVVPPKMRDLIRRRVRWVKQDICNFDRPLSLAIEQAYLQGMHDACDALSGGALVSPAEPSSVNQCDSADPAARLTD